MESDEAIKICDAHVHLTDYADIAEIDQVLARSKQAGISLLMENATSWKSFDTVLQLHQRYPDMIVPACGYHPCYLADIRDGWYEQYMCDK